MNGRHRSTARLQRGGRRLSGQVFAHHQAHNIGQRRLVLAGGAAEALGGAGAVPAAPPDSAATPSMASAPMASTRACSAASKMAALSAIAGAESIVNFLVVIGLAQRIGIAGAAHECHFLGRQGAGGRGQAGLQTLEAGRLGGEIDFQLRLARQRAHRGGDGPLERLGRRFQVSPRGLPLFNWISAYAGMLVLWRSHSRTELP